MSDINTEENAKQFVKQLSGIAGEGQLSEREIALLEVCAEAMLMREINRAHDFDLQLFANEQAPRVKTLLHTLFVLRNNNAS